MRRRRRRSKMLPISIEGRALPELKETEKLSLWERVKKIFKFN